MLDEHDTKRAINEILERYKPLAYWHMSVPTGYGRSTLDYLGIVNSYGFAIEAKAPGKKPSPRQDLVIAEIESAGGKVFVIDSSFSEVLPELDEWLRTCVKRTG